MPNIELSGIIYSEFIHYKPISMSVKQWGDFCIENMLEIIKQTKEDRKNDKKEQYN